MLLRIGSTLAGLLATGIPIAFNATDTTQGQLQLIQQQNFGLQAQNVALQQQLTELTVLGNRT